jgi:DNA ligase-1
VKRFAALMDALVYMPSRNGKLRLIRHYLDTAPDPDRGWALAALTGDGDFRRIKPAMVRELAADRLDPVLFGWSYDFVGDLAETLALMWPDGGDAPPAPGLGEMVEHLAAAKKDHLPRLLAGWLDRLDSTGRWALLKFLMGGLRVGVSARLAKTALAQWGGVEPDEIEELWHGLEPPYADLFAWLDGREAKPDVSTRPVFHPVMLANPLEDTDLATLDPADYQAEWKWDGIRVQVVARGGETRLYTRTGEDIGAGFPDILTAVDFEGAIDGELLVRNPAAGEPASFNALQQRLNRKTVSRAMLRDAPAFIRVYDILFDGAEDLRRLPLTNRRARLEGWIADRDPNRFDLSGVIGFAGWEELAELRRATRENGIEGLMLKRRDAAYLPGRPKGSWFKWKRDPLTADAVLMYAVRGHGKRSGLYSDFTFGVWREDGELTPVGKAYFGFTDEELGQLDRWVRAHTTNRFGPVREVERGLVLEVAFDSLHDSRRHKSGIAMRFPRISRIRWDKPVEEADSLSTLRALIG